MYPSSLQAPTKSTFSASGEPGSPPSIGIVRKVSRASMIATCRLSGENAPISGLTPGIVAIGSVWSESRARRYHLRLPSSTFTKTRVRPSGVSARSSAYSERAESNTVVVQRSGSATPVRSLAPNGKRRPIPSPTSIAAATPRATAIALRRRPPVAPRGGDSLTAASEPSSSARSRADCQRRSGLFSRQRAISHSSRAGDRRHELRHRSRPPGHDRRHQTRTGSALERSRSGHHLIEHRSQRPEVAARVGLLAFELLRSHVEERAHDRTVGGERLGDGRRLAAGAGGSRLECLRQTEVEHLDAVARQHHVAGLEVAVDDAGAMGGGHRLCDLAAERDHVIDRQCAARQSILEGLALEVLHDQEVHAVLGADVVERADVRMAELRDRPRLAPQPLTQQRILGELPRQHLDRHLALEARVARAIDLSHAALAAQRHDLVGTQASAWCQRHWLTGL